MTDEPAAPDDDDAPECTECGACCFSELPEYTRVWGRDHARLGEHADALTVFHGHRCYMRMDAGRCAALVIDADAGRFLCSVYESRPDVCRDLARGSAACRGERFEKRDRPHVALAALRRPRSG